MSTFPFFNKSNYVYRALAPIAVSQILNSIETLANIDIYKNSNYLRGNVHIRLNRSQYKDIKIFQKLANLIDSPRTVKSCALINMLGSSILLASKDSRRFQALGAALVLCNNKLLNIRNSYGRDGADQMGNLILSYRLITAPIKDKNKSDDLFLRATNAQTCLSYLVPGIAKAASNTWVRGNALEEILHTNAYGKSSAANKLKKYPRVMKFLTWFTILWESFFPVIYFFPPKYVRVALSLIKIFHVGVALTMGLPRFFWGFMGAHSAVEYTVGSRIEKYK